MTALLFGAGRVARARARRRRCCCRCPGSPRSTPRRSASRAPEDHGRSSSTFGGGGAARPREPDLHRRAGAVLGARRVDVAAARRSTSRPASSFDCLSAVPCDPALGGRPAQLSSTAAISTSSGSRPTSRRATRACSGPPSSTRARWRTAGPPRGRGYTEPVVQIARRFFLGARFDLTGLPSGPSRAAALRRRRLAHLHAERVLARPPLRAGAGRPRRRLHHRRVPAGRILDGRARRSPVLIGDLPCALGSKLTALVRRRARSLARRAPRRGQAAGRRHHRDARRSLPAGRRRSGRRHVAVARLPGSALRRGQAVAGADAQPRRRARLRRARSRDRLAAAAGPAVAQRAHPARAAGQHRRVDGDQGRGRAERPRRSAARARRHPPARQSALLDPAQERARDRARPRPATDRARRRGRGRLPGRPRRASSTASTPRRRSGTKAAAPLHGLHVVTYHKSWSYVAELARPAGGRLRRAEARASRRPPTTPRSSSS